MVNKKIVFLIIALIVLFTPDISNPLHAATFTIGNGTETCFDYNDPVSYTSDISNPEMHLGEFGVTADRSKILLTSSSGTFNWSSFVGDPIPTRPVVMYNVAVYENSLTLVYTEPSRQFTIQNTPCSPPVVGGTITSDNPVSPTIFTMTALFFGMLTFIVKFSSVHLWMFVIIAIVATVFKPIIRIISII